MAELPYFFWDDRKEPGKRAAWVMAIAVHLLLAAFLFYGIRWQTSAPETVSVELVSQMPAVAQKPPEPQPKPPEPEAVPPKEPPREEPPPPPRKADILRKEPEKPKQVKPPVEKLPPKEKPQRVDPIAKMLEREAERMQQNKMAAQIASAQASLKPSSNASAPNKGLADYLSKVRAKIRGNIVLPQSINGNPESVFAVTQLPSGEVLAVKLKTSSGNPALDTAVERAILKSSPLPKPDNPSLFERELEIRYRPLED